jgi:hypothetical protein
MEGAPPLTADCLRESARLGKDEKAVEDDSRAVPAWDMPAEVAVLCESRPVPQPDSRALP